MTCYVKDTNRGRIILTGQLGPHCTCGWVNTILCDYPVGNGKTCDRKLCEDCGKEVAPDTHYCPDHHQQWQDFVAAGGVTKALENVVPYKPFAKRRGL